jgi:hypothetical protein
LGNTLSCNKPNHTSRVCALLPFQLTLTSVHKPLLSNTLLRGFSYLNLQQPCPDLTPAPTTITITITIIIIITTIITFSSLYFTSLHHLSIKSRSHHQSLQLLDPILWYQYPSEVAPT